MMRRTPLRAKPRVWPQRPDRSAEFASWSPTPLHRGVYAPAQLASAPKDPEPVRSEEYRRLVAAMPCALCCRVGASQAAHPNGGKAKSRKACDLLCFPLCHEGANGCHRSWDEYHAGGRLAQAEREPLLAEQTQRALIAMAQSDQSVRRVLERVGIITTGSSQ